MTHRIFVAIPISEDLQNEILEWEKSYKNLPVKWLRGKNLHITLVPPWEEENVEKVKTVLKLVENRAEPLEVIFEKVEFGPHFDEPRLIWAEGQALKEIQNLKIEIENVLGREPESRPFKLHLTLARFRPKDFVMFPVKKLDEKVFWEQKVKSFVLMESRLLPDGADYDVLGEVIL